MQPDLEEGHDSIQRADYSARLPDTRNIERHDQSFGGFSDIPTPVT
jgi:hypothetical protein